MARSVAKKCKRKYKRGDEERVNPNKTPCKTKTDFRAECESSLVVLLILDNGDGQQCPVIDNGVDHCTNLDELTRLHFVLFVLPRWKVSKFGFKVNNLVVWSVICE